MVGLQKGARAVIVIIALFALIVVGAFVFIAVAMRRAALSALDELSPGAEDAKESAQKEAEKVNHAPDDDISRRIDELRQRGREGK